jgi:outer membrane immunogenic protein
MKKLLAAAALVAGGVSAQAADLPAKAPYYKAPVVRVYDWTGFYIGGNLGFGFNRDLTIPSAGPLNEQARISPLGLIGGGQIGYNKQIGDFGLGNVVLGVETDFQGSGLNGNRTCGVSNFCPSVGSVQYSQQLNWFGTARGRIGLATGSVLSYFTAGFAYGNVETGFTSGALQSSSSQTRTGWTIGSGVETALGGNWTGKIEYLYVDLGTQTGAPGMPTVATFSSTVREQIVRAGLNYRFGPNGMDVPAPVRNWAGLYIGGNGGSAVARNQSSIAPASAPAIAEQSYIDPNGYVGGGQIGYNWQMVNVVFGLEADFQGSTQKDDKVCLMGCQAAGPSGAFNQKMDWFGTARGRLGYSIGSTLLYTTAGAAYGDVKTSFAFLGAGGAATTSVSSTKVGWTVGGGIESPFNLFGWFGPNWTSKTEYLYVDLGRASAAALATPGSFGGSLAFSTHVQEHIFRGGLNYNFNSPVVAKY